jgi:beta-xylosidase
MECAVKWMKDLGVTYLRTGLSWADSFRPGAERWFDRQMSMLDAFDTTITFCFAPEDRGIQPNHTSPPKDIREFADFCAKMTRRYAAAS